jgi:hypothetical protein
MFFIRNTNGVDSTHECKGSNNGIILVKNLLFLRFLKIDAVFN